MSLSLYHVDLCVNPIIALSSEGLRMQEVLGIEVALVIVVAEVLM